MCIRDRLNNYTIVIEESNTAIENKHHLFFLNLGGYRPGEFEELHYKMLVVSETSAKAITEAKQTAFYRAAGFKGAESHIDDKYTLDAVSYTHLDVYKRQPLVLARQQPLPNLLALATPILTIRCLLWKSEHSPIQLMRL